MKRPEQAVAIEVAREHVDAPAVQRNVLLPVAAGYGIEPRAQEIVEGGAVGLVVGRAEEAEEILVLGRLARAASLRRVSAT